MFLFCALLLCIWMQTSPEWRCSTRKDFDLPSSSKQSILDSLSAELKLGQWVCIGGDVINDMQRSLNSFAKCRTCAEQFTPARQKPSSFIYSVDDKDSRWGKKKGGSQSETLYRLEPCSAKQDVTHSCRYDLSGSNHPTLVKCKHKDSSPAKNMSSVSLPRCYFKDVRFLSLIAALRLYKPLVWLKEKINQSIITAWRLLL